MTRILLAFGLALGVALASTPAGAAASDPQQVVSDAITAVQEMKTETGFARSGLLRRAKAVLIVPAAVKVAVGVGGEGSQAVLLARRGRGWSDPAFYTVAAASAGFQLGARETTTVLLIMTQRALNAFLQDTNVTVGAQANLTAAQYSANTVGELGGQDIVLWSRSQGLFAGGSVSAQGFTQNRDYDREYYGRNVSAAAIIRGAIRSPDSQRLRAVL
jgi:SH3 domain-containing YSC84-like protein 1